MLRDSLNSRVVGLFLASTLVALSPSVSAQSDEQRAAARALATDGATAFKQARWKDAVDLFGRAESLLHAPPHLLYLARAHEKLGELVKAREAYLKITRETLPANAPQAFRDAQTSAEEELQKVEPRIAALTLRVDAPEASDVSVLVDGAAVPKALIGVGRPIDPGEHRVEARATGFLGRSETFKLGDGERKTVALTLAPDPAFVPPSRELSAAGAPAEPEPPLASPTPVTSAEPTPLVVSSEPSGNGMLIGSFVAYGVGALGLGLGTFFAISSAGKSSDADAAYATCSAQNDCRENDPSARRTRELDDEARQAKTLSIVGFAVGGAGIAAGTALLLLSPSKSEAQQGRLPAGQRSIRRAGSGLSVHPFVGLGGAGVVGSF